MLRSKTAKDIFGARVEVGDTVLVYTGSAQPEHGPEHTAKAVVNACWEDGTVDVTLHTGQRLSSVTRFETT